MEKRRALITGATGQDGTYLAAYLGSKDYEVFGIGTSGSIPRARLTEYREIDIRDHDRFAGFIREVQPHECYHLAAFHRSSGKRADQGGQNEEERISIETNFLSVHTLLQTLRDAQPACRVFLAGSCHMFGDAEETPQTERTPFAPTGIYGVTKVAAAHLGRMYRARGDLFVCTGILYNHESPLRGPDFVSTRIVRAAVDISRGNAHELILGNLNAEVDWGFAGDYVQAMHLMLQAETPEDFIIASGELHRVRDFVKIAFDRVGLDWPSYVREDSRMYRPVSRAVYQGDPRAIYERLGWRSTTSFKELVEKMVDDYATSFSKSDSS